MSALISGGQAIRLGIVIMLRNDHEFKKNKHAEIRIVGENTNSYTNFQLVIIQRCTGTNRIVKAVVDNLNFFFAFGDSILHTILQVVFL